jgi:phage terminase small subunit
MAKKVHKRPVPKDDRRARFAAEYLIDANATQAAIRAGYSPHTAKVQGSRLLTYADVQKMIAAGAKKIAKKLDITAERVTQEMGRLGFSDIRKAATWRTYDTESQDEDGESVAARRFEFELHDSQTLDDDTAAAISEISMTANGPKVKFYDKHSALVSLAKITGLFREEPNAGVPVRYIVEWAK